MKILELLKLQSVVLGIYIDITYQENLEKGER